MTKERIGFTILLASALVSFCGMFFIDTIIQDEQYHLFSDSRAYLGIPNFWNVISNGPFIFVGLIGLFKLKYLPAAKTAYFTLVVGIILISIGSGYYHLQPNNETLVWDRLPMTIVFMSLFSIIIIEFISMRIGKFILLPLIIAGLLSVAYWKFSEPGDLRFYALVQFYPMVAIPFILVYFRSKYTRVSAYWILMLAYVVAKVFEHFDGEIYNALGFISGHSLKHFVAAVGLYVLMDAFGKRNLVASD